jgi:hypothetical protein
MASPNPPSDREYAQQRLILKIIIGVLVLAAVLVLTLATKLPLSARLFAAGTDVALAAVLWLVLRQKFPKR